MPRLRGTEMPQQQRRRQSPRASFHLLQASSEPNSVPTHHHRGSSPKPDDHHRRSPRTPLHEITTAGNQRKRGTSVANLETKLDHAKEELRKVKAQLASAQAAKKDAQHELEETKKMIPCAWDGEHHSFTETHQNGQEGDGEPPAEAPSPVEEEKEGMTHVVVEEMPKEKNDGSESHADKVMEEEGSEEAAAPVTPPAVAAQMTESKETGETTEEAAKHAENVEVVDLRFAENASLKKQLAEAEAAAAAALAMEDEMLLKLTIAGEELADAKAVAAQLREQLESAEVTRASLEAEMRRMRVQTEQWRKAAEAAAALLTPPSEADGPSVTARCGSMDEHVSAAYEAAAVGSGGFSGLWSPLAAVEAEEGLGGGRKKGGGIWMFGDLWKRKGQHQQKP